jgi:hypothetical protein
MQSSLTLEMLSRLLIMPNRGQIVVIWHFFRDNGQKSLYMFSVDTIFPVHGALTVDEELQIQSHDAAPPLNAHWISVHLALLCTFPTCASQSTVGAMLFTWNLSSVSRQKQVLDGRGGLVSTMEGV